MKKHNNIDPASEFKKLYVTLTAKMLKVINDFSEARNLTDIECSRLKYLIGTVTTSRTLHGLHFYFDTYGAQLKRVIGKEAFQKMIATSIETGILTMISKGIVEISHEYLDGPVKLYPILIENQIYNLEIELHKNEQLEVESKHIILKEPVASLQNAFLKFLVEKMEVDIKGGSKIAKILNKASYMEAIGFSHLLNFKGYVQHLSKQAIMLDPTMLLGDKAYDALCKDHTLTYFNNGELLFVNWLLLLGIFDSPLSNVVDTGGIGSLINDLTIVQGSKKPIGEYFSTLLDLVIFIKESKRFQTMKDDEKKRYFIKYSIDIEGLNTELRQIWEDIFSFQFVTKNVARLDEMGFDWVSLHHQLILESGDIGLMEEAPEIEMLDTHSKEYLLKDTVRHYLQNEVSNSNSDIYNVLFDYLFPNTKKYIDMIKKKYGYDFLYTSARLLLSLTQHVAYIRISKELPVPIGVHPDGFIVPKGYHDAKFETIYVASCMSLLGFAPPCLPFTE